MVSYYPREFIKERFSLHDAYVIDTYADSTFSPDLYSTSAAECTYSISTTKHYRTNDSLFVTQSGGAPNLYYTPKTTIDYTKYSHAHVEVYATSSYQFYPGVLYNNTRYYEKSGNYIVANKWNRVDEWITGAKYSGTGSALPSANYVTMSIEFDGGPDFYMTNWILYNMVTASEYTHWVNINGSMEFSQGSKGGTDDIGGRYGNITHMGKQSDMVFKVTGIEGVSASAFFEFLKSKVGTQVLFLNSDLIRCPVVLTDFNVKNLSSDTMQYVLTLKEYNND